MHMLIKGPNLCLHSFDPNSVRSQRMSVQGDESPHLTGNQSYRMALIINWTHVCS